MLENFNVVLVSVMVDYAIIFIVLCHIIAGELPLENLPHPSLLHLYNFVCVLLEMFSTLLNSDQLTSTRFVLKEVSEVT